MIRYCWLILFISFIILKAAAQKPFSPDSLKLPDQFNLVLTSEKYVRDHPKEKVHVHFDQSIYAIGDTVWYKVYVVNGYNNQLSALSKIVHIQILKGEGQVLKILLPVNAGMASGHLVLSDEEFKKGIYPFNVYTRLMENDSRKLYAFNLNVGVKENAGVTANSSDVASLQFYPEGGSLVAGLRSKVVIKSQDSRGNPIPANGYVIDKRNNKVAEFTTGESGMGLFALSPKREEKYSAVLERNLSKQRFDLPNVLDAGFVLGVNNISEDTLMVRISNTVQSMDEVQLVFQANGSISNVIPVSLLAGSAVIKVPTVVLPKGMNEVALFSSRNVLLANRFLYVPEKKSPNQLILDQNEYGTREPVKIKLNITDAAGTGIAGGYSVSVAKADEDSGGNISGQSIWSSLIFNQGDDHQSFLTDHKDETTPAELDMHLITQNSGSFYWPKVFSEHPIASPSKPERSLSIGGKVFKTDGKPMAGAKLSLFAAKNMMLIDTVANENGVFKFENFSVLDSTEVVIRVTNLGKEKKVQVILDEEVNNIAAEDANQYHPVQTKVVKGEGSNKSQPNHINAREKVNELKTVEIAAKRRQVISGSAYPFAAAPPDYTIETEELHKIINLTDYLSSRFVGVKVINNKVIGTCQGKEGPMFILLNGQNIEDLSFIDPRSLTGVQMIKGGVTAAGMANQFGESMYGQGICFGIIFLTSNHHNPNFAKVTEQTTGIVRKKIAGFPAPKAFYSPDYMMKKQIIAKDLRDPLFWKADIITDKNGMAALEFYTSDKKGMYQVTLEGIGINGQITREVAFFTVE